MIRLDKEQAATLRPWFLPEKPGKLLGLHVINTGHGSCWVDRWPNPRGVLVNSGLDYFLAGGTDALDGRTLRQITGWVDVANDSLLRILREERQHLVPDDRLVLELVGKANRGTTPSLESSTIRPLLPGDTGHLDGLSAEISWIHNSWGGAEGLAASGHSWGAFVNGRLASVACTFYVGDEYEDVGVVTEPEYRGLGLSAACAAEVCDSVMSRGRRPTWLVSSQNPASLRVAQKLGFSTTGHLRFFGCGLQEPPQPMDSLFLRSARFIARKCRSLFLDRSTRVVAFIWLFDTPLFEF